jgi:hypothetical protein
MAILGISTECEDELLAEELEEDWVIDNWVETRPQFRKTILWLIRFFADKARPVARLVVETGRLEVYTFPPTDEPYIVLF